MDMPRPGPAQERLKSFIGEWRGEEKMHPSPWMPQGGVREARISNRDALDGLVVIQEYAQLEGGKSVYQGHAVIMKSPQAELYQMHWFDSFGYSLFEGPFDGAKAVFTSQSPMGWTRGTFEFSSAAYKFRMENSKDGKAWAPMLDGQYRRA